MLSKNITSGISLLTSAALFFSSTAVFPNDVKTSTTTPTLVLSDNIDYNDSLQTVIAKGNVYIAQDKQLLFADRITYNKLEDKIIAEGNVWIRDKDGSFSFSDYAEIKNEFKDGFVTNIKMLMIDDSRAAAVKAKRFNGEKVVMWQGVYSPCKLCKSDSNSSPLWQLKANKIVHDSTEKELTYHNMIMDFCGIPVFYTPYFFHPDPSVKRKTGLLTPSYGSSDDFGVILSLPFFWNISPNSDLTFYPTFTTKEGLILGAEYRHLFSSGDFKINGSYSGKSNNNNAANNNPNNYKIPGKDRWHAFLDVREELSPDILFTAKIRRASDLTYLRRYPINSGVSLTEIQSALTSTAAIEQFKNTSYSVIRGYVFQADDRRRTPFIYPVADVMYETIPGEKGETFGFNFNFLNLNRQEGLPGQLAEKMTRGSLDLNGQIPFVSKWGDIWQLKGSMRGDAYWVDNYRVSTTSSLGDEFRSRLFAQGALTWCYPLINYFDSSEWVLEPTAMIVTGAQGGNSVAIPNEDSPFVSLEPANLFLMNRFYGIDKVDTGSRLVYGAHSRNYYSENRHLFIFLGQTQRLDDKTALPQSSGENNKGSGVVGKFEFQPLSKLSFRSRFVLNRSDFSFDIAESNVSYGFSKVTLSAGHVYYGTQYSTTQQETSQINWGFSIGKIEDFTLIYNEIRNLNKTTPVKLLSRTISVNHEHQCFTTSVSFTKLGYRDRDLRPDTIVMLQFTFKNLGTFTPLNNNTFLSNR